MSDAPAPPSEGLYLGVALDDSGAATAEPVTIDPDDLTTHGVIVGMTGSGKTGLGVVLVEEALLAGVSVLAIDPKGDLANLLLTFPDLAPDDFRPWVDERAADAAGVSADELASDTATAWRDGLARSGIGPERIGRLRDQVDFGVYTPGSEAAVPVDLVGSLRRPPSMDDMEAARDEIAAYTTSLLGLAGIDADPLASREHVLIANLVEHAWAGGEDLDLAGLLGRILEPPLRKLGVIDLDSYFPADDRRDLVHTINALLASPSFAAWRTGVPLDIDSLLWTDDGRPRCSIISIAHLDDGERQMVVSMVLSRLITWMRAQAGSSSLRALVSIDEVYGYVPPTAMPPAKRPILTLLKQARAYGVGMVLATQNPVDLDYKAISNAGTWMIGRLQTVRDRDRLLDGMGDAAGSVDLGELGEVIGGLDGRQFVLHSTRSTPRRFTTRWAMSYLAGPLTRAQLGVLSESDRAAMRQEDEEAAPVEPSAGAGAPTSGGGAAVAPPSGDAAGEPVPIHDETADDETGVAPTVADDVPVRWLAPSAPWAAAVGADPSSTTFAAALWASVRMTFDERRADDLRVDLEWEAVVWLTGESMRSDDVVEVDHDERDLRADAPEGAVYVLPPARVEMPSFWRSAGADVRTHVERTETLALRHNPSLDLWSRPGESAEAFARRCDAAADDRADTEADELRRRMATRLESARRKLRRSEDRAADLLADATDRQRDELLSGAGSVLDALFGGRRSARSIGRALRRGSRSRSRAASAQRRAADAGERVADAAADLHALEDELADGLVDIEQRWSAAVGDVEAHEVTLERDDIEVTALGLLWMPVRR
ncbi:MAG: helicase HerA-like domain-containing protein [Actinomycetota bacterium]|nr:helicase HerA-like domain-containing protein [Actinomycetota bacterium]